MKLKDVSSKLGLSRDDLYARLRKMGPLFAEVMQRGLDEEAIRARDAAERMIRNASLSNKRLPDAQDGGRVPRELHARPTEQPERGVRQRQQTPWSTNVGGRPADVGALPATVAIDGAGSAAASPATDRPYAQSQSGGPRFQFVDAADFRGKQKAACP